MIVPLSFRVHFSPIYLRKTYADVSRTGDSLTFYYRFTYVFRTQIAHHLT